MLPEIQIKKLLDFFVNKVDEKYLYRLFEEDKIGDYYFTENAKKIFLRNPESDRQVQTHIFFNHERASLPTIHINLPSESMGGDNGIDWDYDVKQDFKNENLAYRVAPKTYSAKFNIIFTSSNTFEVLIMYSVIKSMIQGNITLLEKNGLRNMKLSGTDIIFNEGFMPQNIFSRALILDCIYTFDGVSFETVDSINNVIFNGQIES